MSDTRDFLVEIGTEELPPKALKGLSEAFGKGIQQGFDQAELSYGDISVYATPRRLAVMVESLHERQADKTVERRGPAITAAFAEDGRPSRAAEGFAKSCAVSIDKLETLENDKGAWLVYRSLQSGQRTKVLIPGIVKEALNALPIPKRMRWADLDAQFVRPVHWALLIYGSEVINTEILSVNTGRYTTGHRFHHPETLRVDQPQDYAILLETQGLVIPDFVARREIIRSQVTEIAQQLGGTVVIDKDLLEEVTAMVEWPVAIAGNFEERFLEIPPEVLITTMETHQKYFHVVNSEGGLMPHFITVSNIDSKNADIVRQGNERVVRPRLADADFFWNQDRKYPLADRLDQLHRVVFQKKLGSLNDKVQRVSKLAGYIATKLGSDAQQAERAGLICKCDLMTEMVREFPSLQGTMGRYYATHDGEPTDIATAMEEHYLPRHAGDRLPATATGRAVAIADKLDTLVGIFSIGQIPSGNKDPFALRRAALGLLRIMIESRLDLDVVTLIKEAGDHLHITHIQGIGPNSELIEQVWSFMMDRLRAYYVDAGIRPDVFEAVLARKPRKPYDFHQRVLAVSEFRKLPAAQSLAAANKRISNIIKQAGIKQTGDIDNTLLREAAEQTLAKRIDEMSAIVTPMLDARDYRGAMERLSELRESVDTFFDDVMVMVEDQPLRQNRLALLGKMRDLFLRTADLSRLQD